MRELAAQLYALVISTMTGNELQMAVQNLVKITKDNHVSVFVIRECLKVVFMIQNFELLFIGFVELQSPETQHGAILALGYMVGRYMSRKKSATSTHDMGQPMNIVSQEDDELVAMATKTIGM